MNDLARLRWRCRRGARELDLLLERFLDETWPQLEATRRGAFERFLDEADPDLLSWIAGTTRPGDPDYTDILEQLRTLTGTRPP